jgi:acetyl-CoA C-acetyltransferase
VDARTPVLVGAAAVCQRLDDPAQALEPAALMAEALRAAGEDAGHPELLRSADAILVPRGFWGYPDPGRLVGEQLGASGARTLLAELGVLQTSLFGRAGQAIQRGDAEIVLVTGGEAKYRMRRAQVAGGQAPTTPQPGAQPDELLKPAADIMHPLEISRDLVMPVRQYAVMESALRHAQKLGVAEHRRQVAELWARFNEVAIGNPAAWYPAPVSAQTIEGGAGNPMLAFPYTKLHCSRWNVDQAAGLVFTSVARARAAGIPKERWVFLRAVAESNHMVPLIERKLLHRSPGFAAAGRAACADAGLTPDEIAHVELYSCFPAAVRIQALELGISESRALTVGGGMTFAGGPLNNFVLQAAVKLAEVLRADPGSHGLLDAVSGMMTKQGVSLWSTRPGESGFAYRDVSQQVARDLPTVSVVEGSQGVAQVAGYTVIHGASGPERGVAYCDLPDGRRALAESGDLDWLHELERTELCGSEVALLPNGGMRPA